MSLLQFEEHNMPLTFADVLILRYLLGTVDENQTINDFNSINIASNLNWSFRRQLIKFIKRFFEDPYRNEDTEWIKKLAVENNINIKQKFQMLRKIV